MENKKLEQLLEELVKEVKYPKEFYALKDQLYKRGVQALLAAEMESHLGYEKGEKPIGENIRNGYSQKMLRTKDGEVELDIPRDRQGTFEPVIVPKHKTITQELEDSIVLLYSKGVSNSDIIDFMDRTYGVKYSTSNISLITNKLLEDIRDWQCRPLESQYAVMWIDGIHYKIRQDGKVISKAAMIVLGIDMTGRQDILSIHIVQNESASSWTSIFNDMKIRGVEDILFLCSDNLKGIQQAVESAFPQSVHQICIVHQIRNSLKFVSYKDRKAVAKSIKAIYQAGNQSEAKQAFDSFKSQWEHKYAQSVQSWTNNWDALTAFLDYPLEIRKLIYTTNIIESFNAVLRKYTSNKKVFPNDEAALKSIYLAAQQIKPKWNKSRFGWANIYNYLVCITYCTFLYFSKRSKTFANEVNS